MADYQIADALKLIAKAIDGLSSSIDKLAGSVTRLSDSSTHNNSIYDSGMAIKIGLDSVATAINYRDHQ